jgi:hypothetical protein
LNSITAKNRHGRADNAKRCFAAMAIMVAFGLLLVNDSYAQKGVKRKGSGGWGLAPIFQNVSSKNF